ncbi:MAG: hypothetical protein AAFN78_05565 [Pseudomonadota bacterium]
MNRYCFIASRCAVSGTGTQDLYRRAAVLARSGAAVSIYLVQNGVMASRPQVSNALDEAHAQGVRVFADDFSLRERGITASEMRPFVEPLAVDQWVRHALSNGAAKLIWH